MPESPTAFLHEFHEHVGASIRPTPTVAVEGAMLRCDFIDEEAAELRTAVEGGDVLGVGRRTRRPGLRGLRRGPPLRHRPRRRGRRDSPVQHDEDPGGERQGRQGTAVPRARTWRHRDKTVTGRAVPCPIAFSFNLQAAVTQFRRGTAPRWTRRLSALPCPDLPKVGCAGAGRRGAAVRQRARPRLPSCDRRGRLGRCHAHGARPLLIAASGMVAAEELAESFGPHGGEVKLRGRSPNGLVVGHDCPHLGKQGVLAVLPCRQSCCYDKGVSAALVSVEVDGLEVTGARPN